MALAQDMFDHPTVLRAEDASRPADELVVGLADSRIGPVEVGVAEGRLAWLKPAHPFLPQGRRLETSFAGVPVRRDDSAIRAIAAQALAFASGEIAVPPAMLLCGTAFECDVWEALLELPYGAVHSYGELADFLGKPGAAQAVGRACGANRIALVIPCHRIVPKSWFTEGKLGGYAWGITVKRILLDLEAHKLATGMVESRAVM